MKRILFVDDDSKILDGLRRCLSRDRNRWELEFAVGGEAALQACEKAPFDIVISDMRMPGMDGATLLGHVRERYPQTARVVLSGYSDIPTATRAVPVAHRFLAKPCEAAELRSAIERVGMLQDLMASPELRKVVGAIGDLPSLSRVYSSLMDAMRAAEPSITEIAHIIEGDVPMSAKILQLANSAFFGVARAVTSLQSAVTYLGIDVIKNLALAAEIFTVFQPDARLPHIYEEVQDNAHRCAGLAERMPVELKDKDSTVVAALLHDVGELVLAAKMPETLLQVLDLTQRRGCRQYEAEEEILGTSHAEIGAYLLGLWGLPYLAVEAIAHHHRPTRISHQGFDISTAVYVVDVITSAKTSNGTPAPLDPADQQCLDTLKVLDRMEEFRALC